jgi:DNA-directed RNA polymerase specialized sigma24 family protein
MPLGTTCHCALCGIELRLLRDSTLAEASAFDKLVSVSNDLREFPSISSLLLHLRTSPANTRSDDLLRELFAARTIHPELVESLFVLAFLPMLHGTIRRVVKHQPGLLAEDITQQTLSVLLQFLRSSELEARQSHFAFAISRAVKRQVFAWANREGGQNGVMNHGNGEILSALIAEESFERHALLRHFLHRCVGKGLISNSELNLLIQFKLEGNDGEEVGESNGISSNALRQRLKRLLAKLRRLAR